MFRARRGEAGSQSVPYWFVSDLVDNIVSVFGLTINPQTQKMIVVDNKGALIGIVGLLNCWNAWRIGVTGDGEAEALSRALPAEIICKKCQPARPTVRAKLTYSLDL